MLDPSSKETAMEIIKVLLIEEKPEDVECIKTMLAVVPSKTFEVLLAKSLQEVKRVLAHEKPHVILTNLFLPEACGFEAFLQLFGVASRFPIVLLTPDGDGETTLQAIRHGAQDFLVRGKFDANLLVRCINHAIERKRLLDQLFHLANYDLLTGLPNRRLLLERIDRCLKQMGRRKNYLFAVFFIDLDRFKYVNESYGHATGDALLVAISKLLVECSRISDTVARLEGDEFAILLDNIGTPQDIIRFAERLLFKLKESIYVGGHEIYARFSIGITIGTSGYTCPEDVLRDADTAMYRAKERGRGRWEVFDPILREGIVERLHLETDLKKALDSGQLFLQYQPVISLKEGAIVGLEALARWLHPVYGIIPPARFIPIAEDCSAMISIGEWVLYTACQQIQKWNTELDLGLILSLNVNLSVKQFSQVSLVRRIESILRETGLSPENFGIELTETAIFGDPEPVARICHELKACGIKINLDDFGVGFSSLSHLRQFQIDVLKIDRAFIDQIDKNEMDFKIVRGVVFLAHSLGIKVVAEGVETKKQLELLQSMNCEEGQGYLFAKPMDVEEVEHTLVKRIKFF